MSNPFVYSVKQSGDLMWARHIGQKQGSFNWEGPQKVGSGWGNFKHLFGGGDGVFYAVDPVIPATSAIGIGPGMGAKPASGGDLWWYRHIGREDGSFNWEGPKKIGIGWGNFKHLFSGGNGIIYAVDNVIPATSPTGIGPGMGAKPASGGDLWWYKHVGKEDGTFRWDGPKKIGTGWGIFDQLFCTGDGVIYGVDHFIPATLPIGIGPGMGAKPASGGDLWWYRHLGHGTGTFAWQFAKGKKVGVGWSSLQQLFSGGDDIIYGVEQVVPATSDIGIGPGMQGRPASGGNLNWYRHLGREDGTFRWEGPKKVGIGWGHLKLVFSGGRNLTPNSDQIKRCGVEDPSISNINPQSFGSPAGRWSRGNLTYNINVQNSMLTQAYVDGVMASAFRQWQNIAPFFTFMQVPGNADINIRFGGKELDARFGVRNGVLASGAYPEDGRLSFDSAEGWNTTPASNQALLTIALHEIGHVLGLRHSTSRTSIMYPYIMPVVIDNETIEAINGLYGWMPQRRIEDRGSMNGPSLAVGGNISLLANHQSLYMAWRGVKGDDSIYWSSLIGDQWTPQKLIPGTGSLHGPALTSGFTNGASTGLFMVWDGAEGDNAIYYAANPNPNFQDWNGQQQVPGAGSSARPAITLFKGQIYMAWKGIAGDTTIYWSVYNGNNWLPQMSILGRGTSEGPALAVINNRLYMFWKGIDGDNNAYSSWLDDQPGAIWQSQSPIAYAESVTEGNIDIHIGTSSQPTATIHGGKVVLAWKGAKDDTGLYFSRFENNEWSGQTNRGGTGSASGPAIASFNGRLYLAWRGLPGDTNLYFSWLG